MTMPSERTRAVLHTREFLEDLSRDRSLPESMRGRAKALLRHYPSEHDMLSAVQMEINPERYGPWCYQIFGIPNDRDWKVILPEDEDS